MSLQQVISNQQSQPQRVYPEDYERIKAELEAMRKLVDQVTHHNTQQNNSSPMPPSSSSLPAVFTPESNQERHSLGLAGSQSLNDTAARSPVHRVSISAAPSHRESQALSPAAHRRSSSQVTRKPGHHGGHIHFSGQNIVNARHHSLANGNGLLRGSHGGAVVRSPNAVRDIKMVEKLKSTESELAAFKKKIAKLEEANRQLQMSTPNSGTLVRTPQQQQESAYVALSDDSDDSNDEKEEDEMLVADLDNRNSDWQAYLGSFHDLHDLTASTTGQQSEDDVPYDPADTQFDENGDEILPSGYFLQQQQQQQQQQGRRASANTLANTVILDSEIGAVSVEVVEDDDDDVEEEEEEEDYWEEEEKETDNGGERGGDDDDMSQSSKSSGAPSRQFRVRRSASKDSDDDSGAEDDDGEHSPFVDFAGRAGPFESQSLGRTRLDSADSSDANEHDEHDSKSEEEDLLYSAYPENESGSSLHPYAARRSSNSFDLADVYHDQQGSEQHDLPSRVMGNNVPLPVLHHTTRRSGTFNATDSPEQIVLTISSARKGSMVDGNSISSPAISSSAKHMSSATSTPSEVSRAIMGEVVYSSAQLHEATRCHDTNTMCSILTSYPKMAKSIDAAGQTVLHVACKSGSLSLVQTLLEYNIDVNVADFQGKTALHLCRDPAIIQLLCEEGASVNQQDSSGLVPLHEYVSVERVDCVQALMAFGANPTIPEPNSLRSSIHLAADLGNYDLLSVLVQESIVPINFDQPDVDGFTPLQLAAACDRETGGQLKIFMLLLNKGASAVLSNERGITPLHIICANRNLSQQSLAEPIVQLLLGLHADPNAQDVDGCTPLIVACAYREWALCKLLLEAGGDLNIPCTMNSIFLQGDTRISFSKEKNDIKTVALMEKSDCTASDLMPKGPRYTLFDCICVPQTRIPGDTRDRCMNCASTFGNDNSFGSMFRISSGKHHCRHCLRVVCQDCSPHEMPRSQMPQFVQNNNSESSMRVCVVCYSVLKERNLTKPVSQNQSAVATGQRRGSYFG